MKTDQSAVNREHTIKVLSGRVVLTLLIAILAADFALIALYRVQGPLLVLCFVVLACTVLALKGFFSLQPNEARVLLLFGAYKGTVRTSGFHWTNPFYADGQQAATPSATRSQSHAVARGLFARNKISLRARTFNGEKLKVNDKRGNPIEIAAVIVWRVEDTAQALFDVG